MEEVLAELVCAFFLCVSAFVYVSRSSEWDLGLLESGLERGSNNVAFCRTDRFIEYVFVAVFACFRACVSMPRS